MDPSEIDPKLLAFIPALAPPPGVRPNFKDPLSLETPLRVSVCLVMALMLVFVSLRVYTRLRITREFGAEDCKLLARPFDRTWSLTMDT